MITRVRARIAGRVQGVGFRPTVYRYATGLGLGGFVRNDPHGVTIEVEGDDQKVGAFFSQLTRQPPRQSVIAGIETRVLNARGDGQFDVIESSPAGDAEAHISPDLATCDDCLRELNDPEDRRHDYPFINCTNCGPRFTILRELPYDRDKTSMVEFDMCPSCDHEYHEPKDRRFHAEPNACEDCGPKLEWKNGRSDEGMVDWSHSPVLPAIAALRAGRIVAVKGIGGYHLACDATNADAVARLRKRKNRPHKALAVMFPDLATVRRYCEVNEAEEAELVSVPRPIVVLKARAAVKSSIQSSVSPDSRTIGAFLPYTPLHHLLLREFEALVMTSANLTDEPIVADERELQPLLGSVADGALLHNRAILHKCDDSVVRVHHERRIFLRRARGFVPNPARIAEHSRSILATGGELKNTFCLVRDGQAFLSQHIGDLKDYRAYRFFTREIESWQKLLRITPEVIAYDLHPEYLSTRYAEERGRGAQVSGSVTPLLIGVQHHHAHIAGVMAEHGIRQSVIGVALDGTGYGTDGTIWGGEFLVADRAHFERVAHFRPYRLPGGDQAVREPWRMAVSVLADEGLMGFARKSFASDRDEACAGKPGFETVLKMIASGFNSPLTSSAGRLFDAVSSILGLCHETTCEAQAAIRLESVADVRENNAYPFDLGMTSRPWRVDFGPTIRAIVEGLRRGLPVARVAGRFHNTIAAAVTRVCVHLRAEQGLNTVALSGGVFQNLLLLQRTADFLGSRGFRVLTHSLVPPNDGGLALGQAAVAAERTHQPVPYSSSRREEVAAPCA